MEKNDIFTDEAFTYYATKSGKVMIQYYGQQVTTLQGNQAQRFISKMKLAESNDEKQLIMAKATGNFKRGNER